jgi:hydrogenase expression/formation protein HypE
MWSLPLSENTISTLEMTCPVPLPVKDTILLGHGSGGKVSAELIQSIFLPAFKSAALEKLDDQAIVSINGTRLAFTTDSFVVKPLFFPGGDIGSLAVHGTANDLAMGGARPLFLSAAFIIEEGLPMDVLRRVVRSLRDAAHNAGVEVVTGDTKVVERGSGDHLFINTTGIGLVRPGLELSSDRACPGDTILVSGFLGDHQRQGEEQEDDGGDPHQASGMCSLIRASLHQPGIHEVEGQPCERSKEREAKKADDAGLGLLSANRRGEPRGGRGRTLRTRCRC